MEKKNPQDSPKRRSAGRRAALITGILFLAATLSVIAFLVIRKSGSGDETQQTEAYRTPETTAKTLNDAFQEWKVDRILDCTDASEVTRAEILKRMEEQESPLLSDSGVQNAMRKLNIQVKDLQTVDENTQTGTLVFNIPKGSGEEVKDIEVTFRNHRNQWKINLEDFTKLKAWGNMS